MIEYHHPPTTSIWPILVGAGITLMVVGILSHWLVSVVGLITLIISLGGWTQENREQAHQFAEQEPEEEVVHE